MRRNTLAYSTLLGGGSRDYGSGIAVDCKGNAYVTGSTLSPDFPLAQPLPAPNNALQNEEDAFVAKIGADENLLNLFNATDTPGTVTWNDAKPVELGVKFQSSVEGKVIGARFYKGLKNTGAHRASLWSATGTLLASATFTNEKSSGWQQVNFSNPVPIAANTPYVVSYHTS